MHDAIVKMKDGTIYTGPMWTWRPQYGWFSLVGSPPIALDDVESLTIQRDGLAQAVSEGWKPGESPDGNLCGSITASRPSPKSREHSG